MYGVSRRQTHGRSMSLQCGVPGDGGSGQNVPPQPAGCKGSEEPAFCDKEESQNSVLHALWGTLTFLFLCLHRTNDQLVAFLSRYRDMNFLKSHGRDNAR